MRFTKEETVTGTVNSQRYFIPLHDYKLAYNALRLFVTRQGHSTVSLYAFVFNSRLEEVFTSMSLLGKENNNCKKKKMMESQMIIPSSFTLFPLQLWLIHFAS